MATEKVRLRWRTSSAASSPSRDSFFQPRASHSSRAAEVDCAYSSSVASVSGFATRVMVRTLVYESWPLFMAVAVRGSSSSAWRPERSRARRPASARCARRAIRRTTRSCRPTLATVELGDKGEHVEGGDVDAGGETGDAFAEFEEVVGHDEIS